MNHHWTSSKPQTGKEGILCGKCRNKGTTGGTHNGCSNCGKVRHTATGRITRKAV